MCRGSVPGGPGWRIHPCGRDTWRTIRNPGHRDPREPCPDGQRWNPWDAPTVRREVALGAVWAAQCLTRCGELGIAAVALVVTAVCCGRGHPGPRSRHTNHIAVHTPRP